EDVCRVAPVVEHIAVSESYRVHEEAIPDAPAVDEPELLVGLRPRAGGKSRPAGEHDGTCGVAHRDGALCELGAQHLAEPGELGAGPIERRHIEDHTRAVAEPEADIEPR